MKYRHPNGMEAEKIATDTRLYTLYNRPVFYNRPGPILSEQELLDFGFKPEEENKSHDRKFGGYTTCKKCGIRMSAGTVNSDCKQKRKSPRVIDTSKSEKYIDNIIKQLEQSVIDNPDKKIFMIDINKKEEKEDWIDRALEEFYDKHHCIDLQFIEEFKEIILKYLPK